MKQKYTLNIADLQISVISDAPAEEVEKVGMILDRKMREIYLKSRCPKTEAALLCALECVAERIGLTERTAELEDKCVKYGVVLEGLKDRNAELIAELDRLRAENAALHALLAKCGAPAGDLAAEGLALDPVSPKEFLEQVADAQTEKPEAETPAEPAIETVTEGKLTVATPPDFAPYEFYAIAEDGTPSLAGFDIALAGYVADHIGLELEIIPMDFDGTISELAAGKADIGMAGYSPDPDREGAMDFSDMYYEGKQAFITSNDKASLFTDLASTNSADFTIAAQTGTIQMDLAQEFSPNAEIVSLTKATDIIAELVSGQLDGAYIETAVAEAYKLNYPELEIVLDVPYDTEGSAAGIVKGNEALLNAVNEAIAAAIADGSMDKFVAEAGEQASGKTGILVDGEIVIDG